MERELEEKLRSMLTDTSRNDVIIVEGARQVGKSYLVNNVLNGLAKPFLAFDLEKEDRLRREIDKTEDFNDFKTLLHDRYGLQDQSFLFFDEAQESRKLAHYVKSIKEDWPEIRVILTGSSMNRFFGKDVRIPVGRTRSICVFSFSFTEFVQYTKGRELADFLRSAPDHTPASRHELFLECFDSYLSVGGYPEAVIAFASGQNPYEMIDEIVASLEEDFSRKEAYQPELFASILDGVSNHLSSPSKYTHFETTKYYAKEAISAMQAWHIILEVSPRSLDPLRGKFLPKRYLHDLGVINRRRSLALPTISVLDTIDPLLRTPLGGVFENAVLLNLVAGESAHYGIGTWKKGNNTDIEVDFILDLPELRAKIPIESKAATVLRKKHYKNIVHYLKLTGQKLGITVTAAPFEIINVADGLKIVNIPIYLAIKSNVRSYCAKHLH